MAETSIHGLEHCAKICTRDTEGIHLFGAMWNFHGLLHQKRRLIVLHTFHFPCLAAHCDVGGGWVGGWSLASSMSLPDTRNKVT